MLSIIILIGIGFLGFCTTSNLWRFLFALGIFIWIGSSWAQKANVLDRMYRSDALMEELGWQLLISWAVALGVYALGVILGGSLRSKLAVERFQNFSPDEFVDAIDEGLASVIGTNHPWAQANWHSLSRQEKINWITKMRPFLSDITRTKSSAEIISVMQKADHQYSNQAPGQ